MVETKHNNRDCNCTEVALSMKCPLTALLNVLSQHFQMMFGTWEPRLGVPEVWYSNIKLYKHTEGKYASECVDTGVLGLFPF